MLSIEHCREALGAGASTSDAVIETLWDQLHAFARVWVVQGMPAPRAAAGRAQIPLASDEKLEVEERAAIMKFDGMLTRPEAESRALAAFRAQGKDFLH